MCLQYLHAIVSLVDDVFSVLMQFVDEEKKIVGWMSCFVREGQWNKGKKVEPNKADDDP